jgi:exoribonuclease R
MNAYCTVTRIDPMPPAHRIHLQTPGDFSFEQGISDIQRVLSLPTAFPPAVEAAAAQAAASPRLPELDRSDLALVTIDPPGAMDLDQAMCLERSGEGFRVYYAIADVAAFVSAGDPVDLEANLRGATLYGADHRIPLHPPVLSEGGASLLPEQLRPALLWTIELDGRGEIIATDVRRARVRSRARYDYASVQARMDAGAGDPMFAVLREIGQLRRQLEQRRGGVSLALPAQEIGKHDDHWALAYRVSYPVEDWNAQISLLTGMAAARLMIAGKVGLLRTLPPPAAQAIARLRLTAKALGIAWPAEQGYPDFIRSLDPNQPRHVAMMNSCTTVLRGAGYAAFEGALPEQPLHSALAVPYAHVTAPLRRLADRYAGEVCVALCAGRPVPDWALAGLPGLPATMHAADRRANQYERAIIDLTEALMMAHRVGEIFDATVIATAGVDRPGSTVAGGSYSGMVMLRELAIEASAVSSAMLPLGAEVRVRLVEADPARRITSFEVVG